MMQEQAEERISARFEKAMMEEIDALVKIGDYGNRSDFLRAAARALLDAQERRNAITVEMPQLVKEFIEAMVARGFYRSEAHAIQAAVDSFFTEERVKEAFKTMKRMEIVTGKKAEVDIESTTPRQIITP